MFQVRQCEESDIPAIEEILTDAACRMAERGQPLWDKVQIVWPRLSKDFAPH